MNINETVAVYQESKDFLEDFISSTEIKNVKTVNDLVENYNDFYLTRKKDPEEDKYFICSGVSKKKKGDKRPGNVQVIYFGKKLQDKMTDEEIYLFTKKYELFIRYFRIFKRFEDINKEYEDLKKYF
jgi:hypothetical protein